MLLVVLGLPIAIVSIKIFIRGYCWLKEKIPYETGSKDVKDILNYIFFITVITILFGVFLFVPILYIATLLYYLWIALESISFSFLWVFAFGILEGIFLFVRTMLFSFLFRFYKQEYDIVTELDHKQRIEEQALKQKSKRVYLFTFDLFLLPMISFILATYLTSVLG